MRKSKSDTAATRDHILATASIAFRRDGIENTGLSDVMHAAGLTHGGFYRHFDSKEQLLAESLQHACGQAFDAMELEGEGKSPADALAAIVTYYLSPKQRDNFETACPLSALGSGLRHSDQATRDIAASGFQRVVGMLQSHLEGLSTRDARARANAMASAMIGSMMLSRILLGTSASDTVLKDTRKFLLQS